MPQQSDEPPALPGAGEDEPAFTSGTRAHHQCFFQGWREFSGARRRSFFRAEARLPPGWWIRFADPLRPRERLYLRVERVGDDHESAALQSPLPLQGREQASESEQIPLLDLVYRGGRCLSDLCLQSESIGLLEAAITPSDDGVEVQSPEETANQ